MASSDAKLIKLNFTQGFHRESTQYAEEGKWYDGDRVRFRAGKPEVLRGYNTKVSATFDGNARDLVTWSDNDQFKRALWGTEKKLYQHNGDQIFDITPVSVSVTLANVFGTSAGTTRVCVSDNAHGRKDGDFVFFTSAAVIGSDVTLEDVYSISVVDSNVYAIEVSGAAGATSTQTGSATFHYLIATGAENAATGLGYGAASYQATVCASQTRAWNQPTSTGASDFISQITQWSLDNWGEDVLANRRGGSIYYFDTDASTSPVRAAIVSGATNSTPTTVDSIIVSPNDRHLICLGSNAFNTTASPTGTYDPMTVRWSNQEDFTNWIPSVSSTSGETVLTDGTRIVGGVRSRNAITIWTDNSLWQMQYVGPPFTFNFRQLGTNCGMIGPHAGVDYNGTPIWMGYENFYAYDGQVRNLPATIRRYVFDNLNIDQKDKIYAGINSEFKEIIWLYPSTSSDECDSYVLYSPEENYWAYGTCFWTTFNDRTIFGNTITTGTTVAGSNLYDNEPTNIFTGNGASLTSYIESGDFDIADGNELMFMDKIIPDFDINTGNIKFSIKTKQYPESTNITEKGPFVISNTTQKVDMRARGRQGRIRVSCNSTGTKWRWGSLRLAVQPDGSR
jgi:hypothetical protein|tara:strand:+ start:256 stop:2115 length:1860 start_codon:yes stop_codon:yes gene_type:complete